MWERSGGDIRADIDKKVEVFLPASAALDPVHRSLEPRGALATRRALAARLVREEANKSPRGPNGTARVVQNDDAGTERRAIGADLVAIESDVELLFEEPRKRCSGDERAYATVVPDATTESGVE